MRLSRGVSAFLLLWSGAVLISCSSERNTIVVGSKNFSEQALLGEIVAQHIEARTHLPVTRRFYLAGSYICQQALLAGRIDTYVEYTGTALTAILHDPIEKDPSAVFGRVKSEYQKRFGLDVLPSLGFNNTFAIVIRGDDARSLFIAGIHTHVLDVVCLVASVAEVFDHFVVSVNERLSATDESAVRAVETVLLRWRQLLIAPPARPGATGWPKSSASRSPSPMLCTPVRFPGSSSGSVRSAPVTTCVAAVSRSR